MKSKGKGKMLIPLLLILIIAVVGIFYIPKIEKLLLNI